MAGRQIRQQITAGNNFDGTAPVDPPEVDTDTHKTYGEEDAGGEFVPGAGTLQSIMFKGGNQSSCEFKIVYDAGGEKQLHVCLFPDRQVHWIGAEQLAANDKVIVTTKHAEYAMSCDLMHDA